MISLQERIEHYEKQIAFERSLLKEYEKDKHNPQVWTKTSFCLARLQQLMLDLEYLKTSEPYYP
jgi:hypothetical protein